MEIVWVILVLALLALFFYLKGPERVAKLLNRFIKNGVKTKKTAEAKLDLYETKIEVQSITDRVKSVLDKIRFSRRQVQENLQKKTGEIAKWQAAMKASENGSGIAIETIKSRLANAQRAKSELEKRLTILLDKEIDWESKMGNLNSEAMMADADISFLDELMTQIEDVELEFQPTEQ